MKRSLLVGLASSALVAAALGCGPKKVAPKPVFDPDALSGPDGKRSGAQPMEVNKLVTDDVSYDKQDMTDWKSIELKGKPSMLTLLLHWDNDKSDMNIDLFDAMGNPVLSSPGPTPGAQDKKIATQIDTLGTYYVRISAPKPHDGSVYSVEADWKGDEAPPPPPPPPPVVKKEEPKHHEHHEHHAPKDFDWRDGVQGRIVSSYREGGGLVLHIDKGSAAGVKPGDPGTVLDGPSGANPLDGGSFKITEVVDDSKCIAKTNLHSVGRNTRVSIMTR